MLRFHAFLLKYVAMNKLILVLIILPLFSCNQNQSRNHVEADRYYASVICTVIDKEQDKPIDNYITNIIELKSFSQEQKALLKENAEIEVRKEYSSLKYEFLTQVLQGLKIADLRLLKQLMESAHSMKNITLSMYPALQASAND